MFLHTPTFSIEPKKTIDQYNIYAHKRDIELLIDILKKNNVETKTKLLEALRHYQSLVPTINSFKINFTSLLALTISIITLFINDKVVKDDKTFMAVIGIIALVIIGVSVVAEYYELFFKLLSKSALYERIEQSMSEIYMKDLLIKKKLKEKKTSEIEL